MVRCRWVIILWPFNAARALGEPKRELSPAESKMQEIMDRIIGLAGWDCQ